jgi:Carboxypeptidase regulatory-like domain
MRYQRWIAPLFLTLLVTSAQAQLRGGAGGAAMGNVHVHIVFDNDRSAGSNLSVQLMEGSSNTPIANTYTDSNGQAYFSGVRVGIYHVVVSGDGIQTTESRTFEVDERKGTQSQHISVQRVDDSGPKPAGSQTSMISASGLNVSRKAQKELDEANEAMAQHDWKKALERLNKAIAIDPRYAAAYKATCA